jgi:hypothetical protein
MRPLQSALPDGGNVAKPQLASVFLHVGRATAPSLHGKTVVIILLRIVEYFFDPAGAGM